ncbi:hypothetical protein [Bradyrhizobium liaoningense]|uniref:hypothetical protein n=1 Tax=Bradyrhizobium liaoningense TaxID=43992 RepID=UPI001BAE5279|nr:hypothetical protein [Bradyrhizobium liaoningense]MBR0709815.1 hypothetical protein [Bradyrhizobium liaoningense]
MRSLNLFELEPRKPAPTAGCIAHHMLLRVATNGYNVSFEKPVVVGHDLAQFHLVGPIDGCRNRR